ncbi:MAG: hypothetical protein M1418_10260 [Deltaproteobacteria bacterium]|nr:hypothetical protein [Deltaproteobacteria bacterium]
MNEVNDSCDKHYFAHTLEGRPPKDWQSLETHLKNVAARACSVTEEFGAGELGIHGRPVE